MLHVRGHKSRQLVHVEVHKLNLNTVINLEYLVSFYMNIHFILKMHINLSRQMKSYGIPKWMKSKATIFKKKKVSQELQTIFTAKYVNSVLRWQMQMHTGYANSL